MYTGTRQGMKKTGHISNAHFINKGRIEVKDQNNVLEAVEKTDTIKKK